MIAKAMGGGRIMINKEKVTTIIEMHDNPESECKVSLKYNKM